MLKSGADRSRLTAHKEEETSACKSQRTLKIVGENIRSERIRHGLSREELAELAHTSVDTIKRFENGEGVRLDMALEIASALNVPFQVLLPREECTLEQVLREISALVLTAIGLLTKE